jgi:hypothetical protein
VKREMQMNSEIEQMVEVWGVDMRRVLRKETSREGGFNRLVLHDRTFATSSIGRVLVVELISPSILTISSCW